MKNGKIGRLEFLLFALFFAGCVPMALKFTPHLISNFTQVLFEECDTGLARDAVPADLKLMEGLLRHDLDNEDLLTALCMGYTGYAFLFVEENDPDRASRLYLRARGYGLRAMGIPSFRDTKEGRKALCDRLRTVGKGRLPALFWTSMSWNAWINLNLDKPSALAQLGTAEACLKRVLQIGPDFLHGAPHVLMGSLLSARPGLLGGNEAKAKAFFDKAMQLSNRRFLLVHYYLARYYAVRTQNKDLFLRLIREVAQSAPEDMQDVCLINAVIKERMGRLKQKAEEFFF
jgi:hypothetical protein